MAPADDHSFVKIQLASCDLDGNLHLDDGATEWLQRLTQPIGVLAVVGPQRSGKSSLLNDLLGDGNEKFKTSAAVTSCTKGLWAKAIRAPEWSPSLSGGWLVLLDTEGLGSVDAPSRDAQAISLTR